MLYQNQLLFNYARMCLGLQKPVIFAHFVFREMLFNLEILNALCFSCCTIHAVTPDTYIVLKV